ncbi:MAG: hypothetical protein B6245_20015 [Desulfobacteraceae bacterium 4572_88]|nr:MAG: hypothetical protein B6245_20015 [Desulfobacteraceae bacterium 4572_88]RLC13201.1 MAG: hypothetical protein DRI57_16685 [Deltaproteobacteria bacterium]
MQIISNIALISINETLIIQLISFLVFLFIINRIMVQPLRKVMSERDAYIGRIELDISRAGKQLEDVSGQLKEREFSVRKQAFKLREKLEASGKQEADQILESVRQDISALNEKTQKEVDAQISEAKKYVKAESERLSLGVMEKILERRLIS